MKEKTYDLFSELTEADKTAANAKMDVAIAVRNKRIEMKKNQKELAQYLGVTQGMISKWENGNYNFTIDSLAALCDKLDIQLVSPLVKSEPSVNNYKPTNTIFFSCSISDKEHGGMSERMVEGA